MLLGKFLKRYLNLPDFVQNVSFVFSTQVIILCAGSASNIILARWLGPEGKGIFSLAILVPWMIFWFVSLGVGVSTTYYVGQKKYSNSQIVNNSLFIAVIIIVFISLLYFSLLPIITKYLVKNVDIEFLRISFFIFPLVLITSYLAGIPLGLQRIKEVSTIDILKTLTSLGFIVLFVVCLKGSIRGAILATLVSFLAGLLFAVFLVLRISPIRIQMNLRIIKDLVGFGLKGHIGTIVQFFNYRLDMFLINIFLTPASVGIYSISVLIAELIWYIPGAVSRVLFPRIASSDIKTANQFTPQVCRTTLFMTVCLSGVLLLIGRPLILIAFGKQFLPSLIPLQILLPGIIALSIAKVLSSDLTGRGKPLYATYTAVVSLVVTVVLDLILIPKLGVPGAALASSISYATAALILSAIYSRLSGNRILSFLLIRKEDFITYRNLIKSML